MGKLWNARECNLESVQRALLSPWGQEQTSHNWAMRDHLQSDREWAEGDSKRHDSAVVIDGKKIKKSQHALAWLGLHKIPACPGPPGQGGQGLQELFVRSLARSFARSLVHLFMSAAVEHARQPCPFACQPCPFARQPCPLRAGPRARTICPSSDEAPRLSAAQSCYKSPSTRARLVRLRARTRVPSACHPMELPRE
jgi:hypothetical protein